MYKPEFFLENETHKIFWNFETQTDLLISARKKKKKNKNLLNSGLCCPSGSCSKKQRKGKEKQSLNHAREHKKLWNIKMTVIPIVIGALETIPKAW